MVVALLAEGVDRNLDLANVLEKSEPSPSSRRAWIEITTQWGLPKQKCVALLAEGVDRNLAWEYWMPKIGESPSSRRAWIEITRTVGGMPTRSGRPPRGGRG